MTRLKTSRHRRRSARSGLRLEPLEPRLPLALAAFTVQLFADAGGLPGPLITDDTVHVGDSFFVEIRAQELDPARQGLRGISLDLAWAPDVLEEIDSPFDPNKLVTSDLPLFRQGTLDNPSGTIENLSGGAFLASQVGRAIGNEGPERFALLRFQAQSEAQASPLFMREGRASITTVPVASLNAEHLDFEPQTITVLPAQMPAVSELPATLVVNEAGSVSLEPADTDELHPNLPELKADEDAAGASVWQNADNRYDVNGVDGVTPLDALLIVNYINSHPGEAALPSFPEAPPPFYDVNGDNLCTGHDILLVVNFLSLTQGPLDEGEAEQSNPPLLVAGSSAPRQPPAEILSSSNDLLTKVYCEPNDLPWGRKTDSAVEGSIDALVLQRLPANQEASEAALDQLFAELAIGG